MTFTIESVFSGPCSSSTQVREEAENSFDTLIGLLHWEDKAAVLTTIDNLEDRSARISELCEMAVSRDYLRHRALFESETFEYYALAAVREGRISDIQFGTLMFVRAALEEPNIQLEDLRKVPLFDGEAFNPQAYSAILTSFSAPREKKSLVGQSKLIQFFQIAKQLPESEKSFICYRCEVPIASKRNVKANVFAGLVQMIGFNLFGMATIENQTVRMIPSFGMMQAFLDATGEDKMTLKPRIGVPTTESTSNSLQDNNAREVGIHCPQIAPAPQTVNFYKTTPLNFMYYHLYLAWVNRCIPVQDRLFYCELATAMATFPNKSETMLEVCRSVYDFIVRMEFHVYLHLQVFRPLDLNERRERAIEMINGWVTELYWNMDSLDRIQTVTQRAFQKLRQTIYGHYGVWMLYKQNCTNIYEVRDYYNALEKIPRQAFSSHIENIVRYNCDFSLRSIIPIGDLQGLSVEELSEVVAFKNLRRGSIEELQRQGFPFKVIWQMSPDERQQLIVNKCYEMYFPQMGVTKEDIENLTDTQKKNFLVNYDAFWLFLNAGVQFSVLMSDTFGDINQWMALVNEKAQGAQYDDKVLVIKRDPAFRTLYG